MSDCVWVRITSTRTRYYKNRDAFKDRFGKYPEDFQMTQEADGVWSFPEEIEEDKVITHGISQDTMEPTWHPCDGKFYDSKSKFRAVTAAHGCVEINGENLNPGPRKPTQAEEREHQYKIGKGIYDHMQRNNIDYKDVRKSVGKFLEELNNGRTEWNLE